MSYHPLVLSNVLLSTLLSNWGFLTISTTVVGNKNLSGVFLVCVADKKGRNAEGTFLTAIFCGSARASE